MPVKLANLLMALCAPLEMPITGIDSEKSSLMSQLKFEKKFGQSPVFIASTLMEDGGILKGASSASLLKEAIHVISCGYEDKTEWGKEVYQNSLKLMFIGTSTLLCTSTWTKFQLFFRLAGYMALLQRIS